MPDQSLWAITSYFNPARDPRLLANYRIFRQRLAVPLVAVECSADGQFELTASDAEILVQVVGDVLWQKERLLNIGLGVLPSNCEAVAWLDCDVIFHEDDWADRALEALSQVPILQPFDISYWLGPTGRSAVTQRPSFASQVVNGTLPAPMLRSWIHEDSGLPIADGYAWVADVGVIKRHGLYDASVVGSGTRDLAYAAVGELSLLEKARPRTAQHLSHVLAWAEPFATSISGRIGFIRSHVSHLWHGDAKSRRYFSRHMDFRRFDFDPYVDVVAATGGAWRWSSNKPEMHEWVRDYFATRKGMGEESSA